MLRSLFKWAAASQGKSAASGRPCCGLCRSFNNDPAYLEAAMPGLSSLSSATASVRADDGLCLRHGRYLGARRSCADFMAASQDQASGA